MTTSYSENIRVSYVSRGCSKATFFNTVICIIAIVLPYLLCYRSQVLSFFLKSRLWIKLERYREQPEILWKHEILIVLDTKLRDSGDYGNLVWTTLPGLKSMLSNQMTPFISSREADTNFDTLRDFLELEITIPLPNNTAIYGVNMMLLFEYKLHKYAMLDMESMIYSSKQFGREGNRYEFVGDMSLVQKEPLWNRFLDTRYNYEVIPRYSSRLEDYTISNIVQRYAYRNVSTILKNAYEVWQQNSNSKDLFTIKGRINYIEETYECWAGFWEMLKWAWVQYFAVFIIIYLILKKFQGTVHKARIFDTYIVVPWEKRLGTQPGV